MLGSNCLLRVVYIINKMKKEEKKSKTRWGCLAVLILVFLVIAGGAYLFFILIYPSISEQKAPVEYTTPEIDKEGKKMLKDAKNYGSPIKDDEPSGRFDPFAPL